MINSIEEAGYEAAAADGVGNGGQKENKNKRVGLRRGKWTTEEENYANRLITEFKSGLLPLTDGTTLRTFLSKLLNCDPMRISKKFVGNNCIGKQVFRRRQQDLERLTVDQIERCRRELADLERRFLERVAQTNRSSKDGAGIKMSGYPEDGMSIGVGMGQLAPWMMPPDEFQAPNSQQLIQKQQEQQMIGQHHQHSMMNHQQYQQQMQQQAQMHYQQQQQQAQMQMQHQQHAMQQRMLSNTSQMLNPFTPGHDGRPDVHAMNQHQYNNLNGNVDYRNLQTPSSSVQRSSMEYFNSFDGYPPTSQSGMSMYSNPSSTGGYSWVSPFMSEWPPSGSASEPQLAYDTHGSPVDHSLHRRQMGSTSKVLGSKEDVINDKSNDHYNVQKNANASSSNASASIVPQRQEKEGTGVINEVSNAPSGKSEESRTKTQGQSGDKQMPRNSSVDNFWLLVDMGDLPQPSNDVLVEDLFNPAEGEGSKVGEPGGLSANLQSRALNQNSNDKVGDKKVNQMYKEQQGQEPGLELERRNSSDTSNSSIKNKTQQPIKNETELKLNDNGLTEEPVVPSTLSSTTPTTTIVETEIKSPIATSGGENMNAAADGNVTINDNNPPGDDEDENKTIFENKIGDKRKISAVEDNVIVQETSS